MKEKVTLLLEIAFLFICCLRRPQNCVKITECGKQFILHYLLWAEKFRYQSLSWFSKFPLKYLEEMSSYILEICLKKYNCLMYKLYVYIFCFKLGNFQSTLGYEEFPLNNFFMLIPKIEIQSGKLLKLYSNAKIGGISQTR